jgi:hypothetical protein
MPAPGELAHYPLVEVTWLDASADLGESLDLNDPGPFGKTPQCRDVGYLISWTPKKLVLAVAYVEEYKQFNHSNTIPHGMVLSVEYLDRSGRCLTRTGKKAGRTKTAPPGSSSTSESG